MKSKKTLYTLIRKEFKKDDNSFICSTIGDLKKLGKFSNNEFEMISKDFEKNKPSDDLHSEFKNDSWVGSYAWWREDNETRVKFLTKLIEINS